MGAIICKVAAVAPGNDLKGVCACVRVCAGTCSPSMFTLSYHIHTSPVSGGERACRVEAEIRGDYRATQTPNSPTRPPPTPSLLENGLSF